MLAVGDSGNDVSMLFAFVSGTLTHGRWITAGAVRTDGVDVVRVGAVANGRG